MNKPHVHAEVIKAWADGAEIEAEFPNGTWSVVTNPSWFKDCNYRVKPKVIHMMGNRYTRNNCEYILAQTDIGQFALICIKGHDIGNRWNDPVNVNNVYQISEKEFESITGKNTFKLIND